MCTAWRSPCPTSSSPPGPWRWPRTWVAGPWPSSPRFRCSRHPSPGGQADDDRFPGPACRDRPPFRGAGRAGAVGLAAVRAHRRPVAVASPGSDRLRPPPRERGVERGLRRRHRRRRRGRRWPGRLGVVSRWVPERHGVPIALAACAALVVLSFPLALRVGSSTRYRTWIASSRSPVAVSLLPGATARRVGHGDHADRRWCSRADVTYGEAPK